MSPNATTIAEEGVYIDNVQLVSEGRFLEADVRALLSHGPYPARNPDANIADLKAQVRKQIEGDYDKFVGRVQERYGDKKDEIVRWADDWYRRQGQPSPPQREAQRPR